jgi:hypothetical protein
MSHSRKTYRVYSFDAVHKIVSVDFIKAASDEEAIGKAESHGFGTKGELWHGRRLVAELEQQRQQA